MDSNLRIILELAIPSVCAITANEKKHKCQIQVNDFDDVHEINQDK